MGFDARPVAVALAAETAKVDRQMSTWKPDSDLSISTPPRQEMWVDVPEELLQVLSFGLQVGRHSDWAFDIGIGDVVAAWGFGPAAADPERIRAALAARRRPAHEVLEIDAGVAAFASMSRCRLTCRASRKAMAWTSWQR